MDNTLSSDSKSSYVCAPAPTKRRLTYQCTAQTMINKYKMRVKTSEYTGQEMNCRSMQKKLQMEFMAPDYKDFDFEDSSEKILSGPWQCLLKRKITQTYINYQSLVYAKVFEDFQKLIESSRSNAQNSSGTPNRDKGAGEAVTQGGTPQKGTPQGKEKVGGTGRAEPVQITGGSAEIGDTRDQTKVFNEEWWKNSFKVDSVIRYGKEAIISQTSVWNFKNEILTVLLGGTETIVRAMIASQCTAIEILAALGETLFVLLLDHICWIFEANGGIVDLLVPRLPSIFDDLASFIDQARSWGDTYSNPVSSSKLAVQLSSHVLKESFKAYTEDICLGIQILGIELVNWLMMEGR